MAEKKIGEKEAQLRALRERRDADAEKRMAEGRRILKRIASGDLTAAAVGAKPAAKRAARRAAKPRKVKP